MIWKNVYMFCTCIFSSWNYASQLSTILYFKILLVDLTPNKFPGYFYKYFKLFQVIFLSYLENEKYFVKLDSTSDLKILNFLWTCFSNN